MSDKSDHDLLVETHTNVGWMREKLEATSSRVDSLEKNQWRIGALLAATVLIWESFKDKLLK